MSKYSTITELAEALGFSPSTVSRALADHPRISQKTKEVVRKKAAEVGFVPNQYAHILKSNRTSLIGLIVPDITLHFYARVVRAIEHTVRNTSYSIVLGHSEESFAQECALIDKFMAMRVDGVLGALSIETQTHDHYQKLLKQGIPLVLYDRVANFIPVPKIVCDDYRSAYEATKYLIDTGCKTIAHITASKNLNNSNNRLYGYLDALKGHGLRIREDLVFYYQFDLSLIHDFLDRALEKYPNLDAVFVFNDYAANTVVQYLEKIGKSVPGDISVIGFSGEPIATYMTPKLTTVEDVADTMGRMSTKELIKMIETEKWHDEKFVLEQNLIIRDTTRKAN